jgi:hypothetical protein
MIRFLNDLISGFSTIKKVQGGRAYRFRYQDKPVFFDSIGMLKEFAQRINEKDVQRFELKASQRELEQNFLNPIEKSTPKVISLYTREGKELKVSRYVMKDGLHPLSLYYFETDGKVFGVFRRTYDYGSILQNLANKLASANQSQLELSKEKWLWTAQGREVLFLEKFGHTQCWYFTDVNLLDFWRQD